jgi:hypothetical protein
MILGMVLENDIQPFLHWLPQAARGWLILLSIVAATGIVLSWLLLALRSDPQSASRAIKRAVLCGIQDLVGLSVRRTLALAWLAVQESIRRRVVVVVGVFVVVLLFAGWFLDPASVNPARLYLSFVLTSTTYLILLLALFLSTLSLPADIKNRTIYTIVTKPVRVSEIVLGRIVGFVTIGTALLVIMAALSYVFVVRGLNHTHEVALADLEPAAGANPTNGKAGVSGQWKGLTSKVQQHRHEVRVDASGTAWLEQDHGHRHRLSLEGKWPPREGQSRAVVETGPPEGLLVARVPVYGGLRFLDRNGRPTDKGVNIGEEWNYRSYIEGGTLAAAIWTFENVTEHNFRRKDHPRGLPVEMTISVFRSYKGDIESGIPGILLVRNPRTGLEAEIQIFRAKKLTGDLHEIPWKFRMPSGEEKDLLRDFVADGKLEICLRCLEPQQYFGAAAPDVWLRASDASFAWNFVEGYFGIWQQMVLVIGFGVMFSTLLSGPIAMLATLGAVSVGLFSEFIHNLSVGKVLGGGPVESMIRIVRQDNLSTDLTGVQAVAAHMIDNVVQKGLAIVATAIPDLQRFGYADFIADGFKIPGDLIAQQTAIMLGFLLPLIIIGYVLLHNREVAQ